MSKKLVIAIVVLLAVLLVYTFTRREAVRTLGEVGWQVPASPGMDALELRHGDRAVVFRKEGELWQQAEPKVAKASALQLGKAEKLFAAGIVADLVSSPGADFKALGLIGDEVLHIKAFAGGDEIASFAVGNEITIEGTYVRRTWVLPEGSDVAYRVYAQSEGLDLGEVLKRDLRDWRERRIVMMDRAALDKIEVVLGDQATVLARAPVAEGEDPGTTQAWQMVQPELRKVDTNRTLAMVNALTNLNVEGFADDLTAESAGLVPPYGTCTAHAGAESVRLLFGAEAPAALDGSWEAGARYVMLDGQPQIYVLRQASVETLLPSVLALQDRALLQLEIPHLVRVDLPGLTLEVADDGTWLATEEGERYPANPNKVMGLLNALARLRAIDFVDVAPAEVAVVEDVGYVVGIHLREGAQHRLFLGATAAGEGDYVYARLDDGPVAKISSWAAAQIRLEPGALRAEAVVTP